MKIREVIKKVCNYLQLDEVKQYIVELEEYENEQLDTQPVLEEDVKSNLNLLIECANNVCVHIATNYIPLYNYESICIENNSFDISKLEKKLFKIKKITNKNGLVSFRLINNNIVCDSGNVNILYSYYPQSFKDNDEVLDFSGKVSVLGYCYGIASEFCLSKGDYEQAYFWDDKYKELLKNCSRRSDYLKLKGRRWF